MSFEQLLGNDGIKRQLSAAVSRGKLSHSYLISGPEGSGKHTLARLLAAAMECEQPSPPCLTCRSCRKVLSGNHPDVIVVDEPEKKQVPVEKIRQARTDAFVRPNEGQRKVFLIPRAQDMNTHAQNALLKILEEPPAYGAFLLLSDAPEKLLPTIRSRCCELHMAPLEDRVLLEYLRQTFPDRSEEDLATAMRLSGGFAGQAQALLGSHELVLPQAGEFARVYGARDTLGLLELFCSMEKWKRAQLAPVLEQIRRLLAEALLVRRGRPAPSEAIRAMAESRTAQTLLEACQAVETALDDCWANVGIANICAGLFAKLR